MKYTINGFSQEVLVRLGLDIIDASILQWFSDFQGTGLMKEFPPDAPHKYQWVSYQSVIDDLPCLGLTNREVIARRFKKGTYTCFRKSDKFTTLLYGLVDSRVDHGSTRRSRRVDSRVDPKTLLLDPAIKDKERFTLSAEEPDEESGPEPDYSALFAEALRLKEAL
jgi:hypothetical protein